MSDLLRTLLFGITLTLYLLNLLAGKTLSCIVISPLQCNRDNTGKTT